MKIRTLNDALRDEFGEILQTTEFADKIIDLDEKILLDAFNAILEAKGKLDFADTNLENAKIALVQTLRNNLI